MSEIPEKLVSVEETWWGELCWIAGSSHGFEVRRFLDPTLLKAYASLQDEGFLWGHRDPLAWHVLVIDEPYEVGEDFVMIKRYGGIPIKHFYPEHTDDPVEPPREELAMLAETIARMRVEAASPSDQLLAELVAKRFAALDRHLVYDANAGEHRFHLYDLDPDRDELAAWMSTPREDD